MELGKRYEHQGIESKWYKEWEQNGYFAAHPENDKPPFCIVIPPPNVTGSLHMGHAVTVTIQDVLCRYKRMAGYDVLWLPGCDHAGIATQMVVERELAKEGTNRHELGREKFLEKVWDWKKQYGNRISEQLRHLGSSLDWSRERFTMDAGLSRAVIEVFVRLYEEGLIYRDTYIINWCPRCRTALSDLEVDHEEKDGALWYIKYPVKGTGEFLTVATTRPETMLGDTAVAVHPDDPRFRHLIGKSVILPLMEREIPIIGDAELVDIEFGTGAVKVTPAHDFNDFATGKRHDLAEINVIDEQGRITADGGIYQGLTTPEAREKVVADLTAKGLLVKKETHKHAVGGCQRCKTTVEPILSKQWFVKIEPLAKPAIAAVESGRIEFLPDHWKKTYYEWMYNIKDWCISRQLWWGHQIPAWYCDDCGELIVARTTPAKCPKCGSAKLHRDPDVLDTWFSSALWPMSTLGWPDQTPDLKKYYPTTLMETGFDIIFFWVARMIMMGLKFGGEVPFDKVYFHGMVRDEKGQKMSKTRGNVIDPLEITEKYGADALRFTFAMMTLQARDLKLSTAQIEGYAGFCNKIYNAIRFSLMQFGENEVIEFDPAQYRDDAFTPADRWILTRLGTVTDEATRNLEAYRLTEAASAIYHFFWHEFCDWYIELAKPTLQGDNEAEKQATKKVLLKVIDASLRLLHPFMPFITEELWQNLPFTTPSRKKSIMIADFPKGGEFLRFDADAEAMERIIELITTIRTIRAENNVKPSLEAPVILVTQDAAAIASLKARESYLKKLARVSALSFETAHTPAKTDASAVVKLGTLYLPLAGIVDFGEEVKRIEKELGKLRKDFQITEQKLGSESFLAKARPELVEQEKAKHAEMSGKIAHLEKRLKDIA